MPTRGRAPARLGLARAGKALERDTPEKSRLRGAGNPAPPAGSSTSTTRSGGRGETSRSSTGCSTSRACSRRPGARSRTTSTTGTSRDTRCSHARCGCATSARTRSTNYYLGNTPAVCRASYIDPRVFDRYLSGWTIGGNDLEARGSRRHHTPVDTACGREGSAGPDNRAALSGPREGGRRLARRP
jgi:hypothetical protein